MKCKKLAGAKLQLCDAALQSTRDEFTRVQTLRDMDTGKMRQRLAMVKGRVSAPLMFCPWCRSAIDTRPAERSPAGEPHA